MQFSDACYACLGSEERLGRELSASSRTPLSRIHVLAGMGRQPASQRGAARCAAKRKANILPPSSNVDATEHRLMLNMKIMGLCFAAILIFLGVRFGGRCFRASLWGGTRGEVCRKRPVAGTVLGNVPKGYQSYLAQLLRAGYPKSPASKCRPG